MGVRRSLRSNGDPKVAAETLVKNALKRNGSDNVSASVVMFKRPPPLGGEERQAPPLRFRCAAPSASEAETALGEACDREAQVKTKRQKWAHCEPLGMEDFCGVAHGAGLLCGVCDGSGLLLGDTCPLCDGNPCFFDDTDACSTSAGSNDDADDA